MTYLARLDNGEVASAREIAKEFGVPLSLLMNVLKELATGGYVESVRGARGGYRLARPACEVNLADLIAAIEGPIRMAKCITGDAEMSVCSIMDRCPIADPVHRVNRMISDFLKNLTLSELVEPALSATKET